METNFSYVTHDQVEAMTMGTRIAVLRDGILQQLDTPQNLYDHPGNIFVAGFIGSPAMNFFDATLVKDDKGTWVDSGSFRVKVPEQISEEPRVKSQLGAEVIFGVRPEDIHDPEFAPPGIVASPVEAQVELTELMGNEIFLYLLAGDKPFMARVDPRTRAPVGQAVQVVMNMENMHLFDPRTEEALTD